MCVYVRVVVTRCSYVHVCVWAANRDHVLARSCGCHGGTGVFAFVCVSLCVCVCVSLGASWQWFTILNRCFSQQLTDSLYLCA